MKSQLPLVAPTPWKPSDPIVFFSSNSYISSCLDCPSLPGLTRSFSSRIFYIARPPYYLRCLQTTTLQFLTSTLLRYCQLPPPQREGLQVQMPTTEVDIARKISVRHRQTHSHIPSSQSYPTPPKFLRIPPPASESRDATYFAPRGWSSTRRYTRNTTPSDNLSTPCLSPGISGGSCYPSDSLWSNRSSEYLIPPNFDVDIDNPPYNPRRESSDSLTMVHHLSRANTMPHGRG